MADYRRTDATTPNGRSFLCTSHTLGKVFVRFVPQKRHLTDEECDTSSFYELVATDDEREMLMETCDFRKAMLTVNDLPVINADEDGRIYCPKCDCQDEHGCGWIGNTEQWSRELCHCVSCDCVFVCQYPLSDKG